MKTRLQRQKKTPSDSSFTSAQRSISQQRAFTVQPKPAEASPQVKEKPDLQTQLEAAERFGHNFGNIPIFAPGTTPPPPIQAKLTIGAPGDKYEQEADRVAAQVVRQLSVPQTQGTAQNQSIQRQELKEEELAQMKPEIEAIQRQEPEEEKLQAKPMVQRQGDVEGEATPDLEASIQQARGSGQPLAENTRVQMEQAFGADFSGVKVHTDGESDQLNRSIQARAFTTGQDIFFRQGAYNPGSKGGQELLAHELTHVVQQNASQVQRQIDVPTLQKVGTVTIATVSKSSLPPEAINTINLINSGGPFPYPLKDGSTFKNREQRLPATGTYLEYTVPTPGATDRGARRIVKETGGKLYYTDDHYQTFKEVV